MRINSSSIIRASLTLLLLAAGSAFANKPPEHHCRADGKHCKQNADCCSGACVDNACHPTYTNCCPQTDANGAPLCPPPQQNVTTQCSPICTQNMECHCGPPATAV